MQSKTVPGSVLCLLDSGSLTMLNVPSSRIVMIPMLDSVERITDFALV
jgi:hypothetical protein